MSFTIKGTIKRGRLDTRFHIVTERNDSMTMTRVASRFAAFGDKLAELGIDMKVTSIEEGAKSDARDAKNPNDVEITLGHILQDALRHATTYTSLED